MQNPFSYLSNRKRREFAIKAQNFADETPGAVIIMADPATDIVMVFHKGIVVPMQMKSKLGKRMHIVENAVNYSKFERSVDQFLLMIDAALKSISGAMEKRRKERKGIVSAIFKRASNQVEEVEASFPQTHDNGLAKSPLQLKG